MTIQIFVVFGLVVGLLAHALLPGKQSMGFVATTLVGLVGSFLGGGLASLISGHSLLEFHSAGLIGSVLGALAVLVVLALAGRHRSFA